MKIISLKEVLKYCLDDNRQQIEGMTISTRFVLPDILNLEVLPPRQRLYIVARPEYLEAMQLYCFAHNCISHAYHYYGDLFPDDRRLLNALDRFTEHVRKGTLPIKDDPQDDIGNIEHEIKQMIYSLVDCNLPYVIKDDAQSRLNSARYVARAAANLVSVRWDYDPQDTEDVGMSAFYIAETVARADPEGREAEWQVEHLHEMITEKDNCS